ncbi:MAG: SUMF1/EgtB/PvdO family nonheme iron enzyme [Candidatus Tectomicrobia bacterium]|uniref:SUMF1/EgtB/PvdO family nonheme iron enzyme n=1 Tax=Tectimicrobiota bacterium TaxID=2528274 RepID=A0A932GM78_UNCTE|nr:SUMF1/EgtB/PvdO family nonheme iron enzyme [Candidatus Tectomicrobia bacterium]
MVLLCWLLAGAVAPAVDAQENLGAWMAERRESYAKWTAANPDHEARLAAFVRAAREVGAGLLSESSPAGMAASLKARSASASQTDLETARQMFFQGVQLFQEGVFEAARKRFDQGLEKDPGNGQAHYFLAETLMRLKDAHGAKRHYELTALLDPLSVEAAKAEVAAAKLPTTTLVQPVVAKVPGAGYAFRDCAECPEMVTIPPGRFNMGAGDGYENEKPVHKVTIGQPFAVGKFEVTRGEYAAFVAATGHSTAGDCDTYTRGRSGGRYEMNDAASWRDPGFAQTDRDPVTCVSWDDAKAYVAWLSKKTGKEYRLLSEAEWEYVARAGTSTAWWCGGAEACLDGTAWYSSNSGRGGRGTQPVGSKTANPFGLYDIHGNVWEWVEDCWNDGYSGALAKGEAWTSGDCSHRFFRGGSWNYEPGFLRSAIRLVNSTTLRNNSSGFRVSRTLLP